MTEAAQNTINAAVIPGFKVNTPQTELDDVTLRLGNNYCSSAKSFVRVRDHCEALGQLQ